MKKTMMILMLLTLVAGTTLTSSAQVVPISEQQARESGTGHDWQGTLGDVNMYSLPSKRAYRLLSGTRVVI